MAYLMVEYENGVQSAYGLDELDLYTISMDIREEAPARGGLVDWWVAETPDCARGDGCDMECCRGEKCTLSNGEQCMIDVLDIDDMWAILRGEDLE